MATTILHLDVNACTVYDHQHWWPQPVPAHRTAPGSSHHVLLIGAGPPDLLPWEITSFKVWPAFLTVDKLSKPWESQSCCCSVWRARHGLRKWEEGVVLCSPPVIGTGDWSVENPMWGRATRKKRRTLSTTEKECLGVRGHAFQKAGYSRTLVLVASPGRKIAQMLRSVSVEERAGHQVGRCDSCYQDSTHL